MKAGFYQFAPAFGRKEENLAKVVAAIEAVDADLIVLPEFFATGYQFVSDSEVRELAEPVPGETTEVLTRLSRKHNIHIVAGLPERDGEKFFNSAVITGPSGLVGKYRKTHLFYEETLFFTPGDTGFRVWDTDIGRIGIMICFDWFFPESMRTLALAGAQVVAHPANLVLPFCPDSMPVRCLENRVFAVTANRTGTEDRKDGEALTFIGKSEVVSPRGELLVRAPDQGESLLVVDIDPHMASDKTLNQYNDLFRDRRPDYYGL
jgi:predicted amidohydrolase